MSDDLSDEMVAYLRRSACTRRAPDLDAALDTISALDPQSRTDATGLAPADPVHASAGPPAGGRGCSAPVEPEAVAMPAPR